MPLTARLSRTLHDALGNEAAADLVDWMQQVDTQRAELRELNELNYARFDSRMNELRDVTAARLGEFRHELRADISDLRAEMKVAIAGVDSKIDRRHAELLTWSFVFWCGMVAAVEVARSLR